MLIDPNTGAGAYKIAGGMNGSSTAIQKALNTLLFFVGLMSGALELLFQEGPFQVISKGIAWLSGLLSFIGAAVECSGVDVFVVLIPILLFGILIPLMLGPLGLGLSRLALYILVPMLSVLASFGSKELAEDRCN